MRKVYKKTFSRSVIKVHQLHVCSSQSIHIFECAGNCQQRASVSHFAEEQACIEANYNLSDTKVKWIHYSQTFHELKNFNKEWNWFNHVLVFGAAPSAVSLITFRKAETWKGKKWNSISPVLCDFCESVISSKVANILNCVDRYSPQLPDTALPLCCQGSVAAVLVCSNGVPDINSRTFRAQGECVEHPRKGNRNSLSWRFVGCWVVEKTALIPACSPNFAGPNTLCLHHVRGPVLNLANQDLLISESWTPNLSRMKLEVQNFMCSLQIHNAPNVCLGDPFGTGKTCFPIICASQPQRWISSDRTWLSFWTNWIMKETLSWEITRIGTPSSCKVWSSCSLDRRCLYQLSYLICFCSEIVILWFCVITFAFLKLELTQKWLTNQSWSLSVYFDAGRVWFTVPCVQTHLWEEGVAHNWWVHSSGKGQRKRLLYT